MRCLARKSMSNHRVTWNFLKPRFRVPGLGVRKERRSSVSRVGVAFARLRRPCDGIAAACRRSHRRSSRSRRLRAVGHVVRRHTPPRGLESSFVSGTRAELSGSGRGPDVGERAPGPVTGTGSLLPAESPPPRAIHLSTLPTSEAAQAPPTRPESSWLPAFVSSFSVRDRVAEIEQGRASSDGSDHGGGVVRLLEESTGA